MTEPVAAARRGPRKPASERRVVPIWGYLTEREADEVMRAALRKGLSVSRLVRDVVLRHVREPVA